MSLDEANIRMQNNEESLTSGLQQEPKSFIDLKICQISVNIIISYTYMMGSLLLNVLNRVIFLTYNFKFNLCFMLFQQLLSSLILLIISQKYKRFNSFVGSIGFSDFCKNKKYYIFFSFMFICNNLSSFYGNQKVINTAMFSNLRKFTLTFVLIFDIVYGGKKINLFIIFCTALITVGTVFTGIDDFKRDSAGYFVVVINNIFTTIIWKFTEVFKKTTGMSNLKLLTYTSFLCVPLLLVIILIEGEYQKVIYYFMNNNFDNDNYKEADDILIKKNYMLLFYLFLSCIICFLTNASCFISNEKNSSLFTLLLGNSKSIPVILLSSFWLSGNQLTVKMVLGQIISTAGAIMISTSLLYNNMIVCQRKNKEREKAVVQSQEIEIKSISSIERNNVSKKSSKI